MGRNRNRKAGSDRANDNSGKSSGSRYRAPTQGYETAVFTMASLDNKDAKTFNDVHGKLVRMIGT